MGWMSIKASWGVARLMFWHKLCWGRNNLANWVFEERKESERRKDKDNWCEATRQLMVQLGLEKYCKDGFFGMKETWRNIVRERVRKREEEDWWSRVEMKPRLEAYRKFKENLELEEYLDVVQGQKRRHILLKSEVE